MLSWMLIHHQSQRRQHLPTYPPVHHLKGEDYMENREFQYAVKATATAVRPARKNNENLIGFMSPSLMNYQP